MTTNSRLVVGFVLATFNLFFGMFWMIEGSYLLALVCLFFVFFIYERI